MTVLTSVIDPKTQAHLFGMVWAWVEAAPLWLRAALSEGIPDAQALLAQARQPHAVNVGIWFDGELAALVQLFEEAPGCFDGHIYAARHTNAEHLADEVFTIGCKLFEVENAQEFSAWVPQRHRANLALCRSCWFRDTGERRELGFVHGKPIKWQRMMITREDWKEHYGRWKQN